MCSNIKSIINDLETDFRKAGISVKCLILKTFLLRPWMKRSTFWTCTGAKLMAKELWNWQRALGWGFYSYFTTILESFCIRKFFVTYYCYYWVGHVLTFLSYSITYFMCPLLYPVNYHKPEYISIQFYKACG